MYWNVWASTHHRLQLKPSEEGEERHRDNTGDPLPHCGNGNVELVETVVEGEAHILCPVVSRDPAVSVIG